MADSPQCIVIARRTIPGDLSTDENRIGLAVAPELARQGDGMIRNAIIGAAVLGCAFVYGVAVGTYEIFPFRLMNAAKDFVHEGRDMNRFASDEYNRLVSDARKTAVECPAQDARTGVLLAIGQSNIANHLGQRNRTEFPDRVFNYFDGKCYVAASPMLGASGVMGEYLTLVGDGLVRAGTYDTVVIISAAVGGSTITRWAQGGDLNARLAQTLAEASEDYRVTDVIWHHGETDRRQFTPGNIYADMFRSLAATLRQSTDAPIYLAIASRCDKKNDTAFEYPNVITRAQLGLIAEGAALPGPNTDELVLAEDRYDGCHFAASGQEKAAAAFVASISGGRTAISSLEDADASHSAVSR